MPVPVIAYLIFTSLEVMNLKAMAFAGLAGVIGGWKMIEGISMIVAPGSEKGDLSNLAE